MTYRRSILKRYARLSVVNLVPEIRKMTKGYEDILNGVAYVEEY